jgi:hypothetical protein
VITAGMFYQDGKRVFWDVHNPEKYLVIDGEYIWKYTHNGYDCGVVGSTPIAFPIEWQSSKIPGWALRATVPVTHGFTAVARQNSARPQNQ